MAHSKESNAIEAHGAHGPMFYVKIWALLLVLLVISIVGPMAGIRTLTLITAFGIAVIKALIVAAQFMHLNIEKKYIHYVLYTMLLAITMFYFGTMSDLQMLKGLNWENAAAYKYIEQNQHHGAGAHGAGHEAAGTEGSAEGHK